MIFNAPAMRAGLRMIRARLAAVSVAGLVLALTTGAAGCGLFYQAGTEMRASRMQDDLQPGMTELEVHKKWGEPDIRTRIGNEVDLWSYAERPNSNDLAATLFYTSAKEGDRGRFLNLKFDNRKLVSWSVGERTMPPKASSGFSLGMAPGTAVGSQNSSATAHY